MTPGSYRYNFGTGGNRISSTFWWHPDKKAKKGSVGVQRSGAASWVSSDQVGERKEKGKRKSNGASEY